MVIVLIRRNGGCNTVVFFVFLARAAFRSKMFSSYSSGSYIFDGLRGMEQSICHLCIDHWHTSDIQSRMRCPPGLNPMQHSSEDLLRLICIERTTRGMTANVNTLSGSSVLSQRR